MGKTYSTIDISESTFYLYGLYRVSQMSLNQRGKIGWDTMYTKLDVIPSCSCINNYTGDWKQIVADNANPYCLPKIINGYKTVAWHALCPVFYGDGFYEITGKVLWMYDDGSYSLTDYNSGTFHDNISSKEVEDSDGNWYYTWENELPLKDNAELLGGIIIVTSFTWY